MATQINFACMSLSFLLPQQVSFAWEVGVWFVLQGISQLFQLQRQTWLARISRLEVGYPINFFIQFSADRNGLPRLSFHSVQFSFHYLRTLPVYNMILLYSMISCCTLVRSCSLDLVYLFISWLETYVEYIARRYAASSIAIAVTSYSWRNCDDVTLFCVCIYGVSSSEEVRTYLLPW